MIHSFDKLTVINKYVLYICDNKNDNSKGYADHMKFYMQNDKKESCECLIVINKKRNKACYLE